MPSRHAVAPSLALAVSVCAMVNIVPVVLGLSHVLAPPDAEVHLFFADHYQRAWLDPWEPRWYGGFWVYSYPPLAHQLLAVVGGVVGLERAFAVVQMLAAVGLCVAVWLLTREVAGHHAAGWAALLAGVVPGAWATLYLWGQLPNLVSLALAIAATAELVAWMRRGTPWALVAWAGLAGASTAAHHLTGMIGLPMLACAGLASALAVSRDVPRQAQATRAALAAICGLLAAAPTVAVFAWWMENGRVAQMPVSHPSRSNFFYDADRLFEFWLGMWAVPLAALLLAGGRGLRNREMLPFVAVIAVWGMLSLGPAVTPLPKAMFGGFASWLTYERFGLWATALLTVVIGTGLAALGSWRAPLLLFVAALASGTLLAGLERLRAGPPADPAPPALREAAAFLDADGRDGWRYLTLGLGRERAIRFSRLTRATSVDGGYLTARRDALLSRSGADLLDGAPLGNASDMGFARILLRRPAERRLRWVVSGCETADRDLRAWGWTRVAVMNDMMSPGAERNEISIWEAPTAALSTAPVNPTPPPSPALPRMLWALAPLALLAVGLAAAARAR